MPITTTRMGMTAISSMPDKELDRTESEQPLLRLTDDGSEKWKAQYHTQYRLKTKAVRN